jgi:MFS family permease
VEDKQDLGNAIALNSSMVNMARLLGPALAGLVIGAVGEGYCFLIDGISYLAVIASLLMMHLNVAPARVSAVPMLEQLKEGWTYVCTFRPIRTILLLFALISLMGMPFMVLMPIFASKVLHGGPHTLGFLLGASGVGALISAISLALRKSVRGLTTMIQISAGVFGLGLICFGLSRVLLLSLFLMLIVGFGMMQGLAASNTVIQTLVPEDKRGRVMSYYTMAFVGMTPFGSLLAGALAHRLGAPHAVMITGAFCVAGAVWFSTQLKSIRKIMRPIYVEMGIIRGKAGPTLEDQVGR